MNKKAENLDSLAKRVNYLIKNAGMKKTHLASKLGMTPQAFNNLCNKNTQRSKHTKEIAEVLNANETWLESGYGHPFDAQSTETSPQRVANQIPIYLLEQLQKVKEIDKLFQLTPIDHQATNHTYNEQSFAFYIKDNYWSPRFEIGDTAIIEPNSPLKDGAYALVFSNSSQEIIFCQLYLEEKTKKIFGFVPNGKQGTFLIQNDDLIYGLFREVIKKVQY